MANLSNNRLNITATTAQITAVKTALQTIATNLPFLTGLTVDERITLPAINVSNKAFTEDAINVAVNNSTLIPAYVNVPEYTKTTSRSLPSSTKLLYSPSNSSRNLKTPSCLPVAKPM